jgi:hypothetical protein
MNKHIITEGTTMAMTSEEAVQKGAKLFADAEAALTKLASEMPKVYAAIRDGGNLGGIETMEMTAQTGLVVNDALLSIAAHHQELTKKAQEKGIDLPVIMSGGR